MVGVNRALPTRTGSKAGLYVLELWVLAWLRLILAVHARVRLTRSVVLEEVQDTDGFQLAHHFIPEGVTMVTGETDEHIEASPIEIDKVHASPSWYTAEGANLIKCVRFSSMVWWMNLYIT